MYSYKKLLDEIRHKDQPPNMGANNIIDLIQEGFRQNGIKDKVPVMTTTRIRSHFFITTTKMLTIAVTESATFDTLTTTATMFTESP